MTIRNRSQFRIYFYLLPLLFLLVSAACSLPGIIPDQEEPSSNGSEESSEDAVPTINSSEATPIMVIPISAKFEVIGDIASLRIGPGIEYPEVGQVSAGDIVTINGMVTDGTWYRLEAQEETWISADFVSTVPGEVPTETVNSVAPTQSTCAGPPTGWVSYTIQPGDTLFSLSSLTSASIDEVMRANCTEDPVLTAGQPLWLPRLPATAAAPDTSVPMPTAPRPPVAIDTPIPTTTSIPTFEPIPVDTPSPMPTASPPALAIDTPVPMPTTMPTATSSPATEVPIDIPTDPPPPNVTGVPPTAVSIDTPVPMPTSLPTPGA